MLSGKVVGSSPIERAVINCYSLLTTHHTPLTKLGGFMPNSEKCPVCKGEGYYDALVSQHDDETGPVKCPKCFGQGIIYTMTVEEEADYHSDYW